MAYIVGIINNIFGLIAKLIFDIVILVYELFFDIANTSILSDSIDAMARNVYAILGVLMLFKMAFSVVQYIINPDQFTNKENGFGSLMKNVFIVMALILIVPIMFDQAMKLQKIILEEDIVGRVVTGHNRAGVAQNNYWVGRKIAFNISSGFVRPNYEDINSLEVCKNVMNNSNQEEFDKCLNALTNAASDKDIANTYKDAMTNNDFRKLMSMDILQAKSSDKKNLLFDFNGITAILVGGFVAYILLLFCIDIAVRSIKLVFLKLISPIPIVSYIDPKSKKQIFDKWVKNCLSTYADLFIRLAAIYFAVFLINGIINDGMKYSDGTEAGLFVKIFMIIGLLMFAKQLPKLIEDILGIKLAGDFTLNPLKKLENVPLIGKQAAGALALGGRTVGNVGRAGLHLGVAGVAGLATGIGGAIVNRNARGVGFSSGFKYGFTNSKHLGIAGANMSRIGADVGGTLGSSLTRGRDDKIMANNQKIIKAFDTMKSMALDDIKGGKAGDLSKEYARRQAELSSLRNLSWEKMSDYDRQRFRNEHNGADLQTVLADREMAFGKWYNKEAVKEFVNRGIKNDANNEALYGYEISADFKTALAGYENAASLAGEAIKSDYDSIKAQRDELNDDNNKIKNKQMAQQEAKKK